MDEENYSRSSLSALTITLALYRSYSNRKALASKPDRAKTCRQAVSSRYWRSQSVNDAREDLLACRYARGYAACEQDRVWSKEGMTVPRERKAEFVSRCSKILTP